MIRMCVVRMWIVLQQTYVFQNLNISLYGFIGSEFKFRSMMIRLDYNKDTTKKRFLFEEEQKVHCETKLNKLKLESKEYY